MNSGISFNSDKHIYRLENREMLNVTRIIGGNLDDFLFNGATMDNIRKAGKFGTLVHDLCHEFNETGKIKTTDKEARRYVNGWVQLLENKQWSPYKSEIIVYSRKYKFAGRLDSLLRDKSNFIHLVDIKVRSSIPVTVKLQTAGYKIAHEEMTGEKISYRWCVNLTGKGIGYVLYPLKGLMDAHTFICKAISMQWDMTWAGKNL